jgi:hypothetical protein
MSGGVSACSLQLSLGAVAGSTNFLLVIMLTVFTSCIRIYLVRVPLKATAVILTFWAERAHEYFW